MSKLKKSRFDVKIPSYFAGKAFFFKSEFLYQNDQNPICGALCLCLKTNFLLSVQIDFEKLGVKD